MIDALFPPYRAKLCNTLNLTGFCCSRKSFSMMSLAPHRRYEIVFLAKHIYGPKFSQTKIAKIMKCHRNTVNRWLDPWEEIRDYRQQLTRIN